MEANKTTDLETILRNARLDRQKHENDARESEARRLRALGLTK